ncbi:hypothetical protein NDR87_34595 [Nocardia sp. CDC159]|uniref:Secreted protein n=1 Tax=Nocardia pulmonis TaxID=2951408 RepID=A0A9X2ED70_9NOCA|nr:MULTISPECIES: hypothetical protein [Nocardia]MCM6778622.1 hypothetical protein [Nocardia pulmonis]MCM6791511.1 hypothetical protein [Nocardia sp. CDC159]
MRTHVPLGLAAVAILMFAPATALADAPTGPMPGPDRCETIVPLGDVEVVQHQKIDPTAGTSCPVGTVAGYSPAQRAAFDAWWQQVVNQQGSQDEQQSGDQSQQQGQSQQGSNPQAQGQQGGAQQGQQQGGGQQQASIR